VMTVMAAVVMMVMTLAVMAVAAVALVAVVAMMAVVVVRVMIAAARVAGAVGLVSTISAARGPTWLRPGVVHHGVGHREMDHGGAPGPGRPDGAQGAHGTRPHPDGGRWGSGFGRGTAHVTAATRQPRRDR
jgi:hypothetical protein